MAYIITVDTRIPRIHIDRALPWWIRMQRRSLAHHSRLLTAEESAQEARQRFGPSIDLIDIQLSIDLTEEELFQHVAEVSVASVQPQESERSLKRGDVTRATRPSDFSCPICLRTNGRVVRTRCKHYFHRECIEHAYRYSERCPICRSMIKNQETDACEKNNA